jgi:preprotein translocase subunit SecG
MANVLIVAYLLIVLALIAVILLQRSEGGGLGIGGGNAGFMTVRGSANLLTRTTAILATLFFATAIGLTILSEFDRSTTGILDRAADAVGEGVDAPTTVLDALNALGGAGAADESLALPSTTTEAPVTTDAPAAEAPATEMPATTETAPAEPAADPGLALPATDAPATTTETPSN